jgi:predicted DNA-binding transcriptional regulator YafY
MKVASRPPVRRLLALDRMIRSGRYPNARTMAAELEVNPRTIYRDLDSLRDDWGAPLAFCRRRNGYYYTKPDFPLPLVRLSEGELVALFLAERVMQQYRGSPVLKDLTTAFRKLTVHLPETVTVNLSHLDETYSFRGPDSNVGDLEHFRRLARAAEEGRQLELLYWSASRDEVLRRVVDPYHLTSVMGDWYLVAFCHLREEVRMFSPSRVRELRETGERFERPADFNIHAYLDSSFRAIRGDGPPQRVRLRFTAEVARYVREKVWHPTQQVREQKDGDLVLTLEVSHLYEVKRWVLSYGAACEVLEPAELREEIRAEIQMMLDRHARTVTSLAGK